MPLNYFSRVWGTYANNGEKNAPPQHGYITRLVDNHIKLWDFKISFYVNSDVDTMFKKGKKFG
jgi:hypothetical protein